MKCPHCHRVIVTRPAPGTTRADILAMLAQPMAASEVATLLDINPRYASNEIARLAQRGLARKLRRGVYVAVPTHG